MVPSRDRRLTSYLGECFIRHKSIFGVNVYVDKHPRAKDAIENLMTNDVERRNLITAIRNPESEDAKRMYNKYKPHLKFAGRNVSHGCFESDKLRAYILETSKRMGPPFAFLTLNMEEANNPRSIRACAATIDNMRFPAVFEENCKYGADGASFMQYLKRCSEVVGEGEIDFSQRGRAALAMDDPITFVEETKQMLNDVCSLLLGIPPEGFFAQADSTSRRKTKYFKLNKGVFGSMLAYIGVTEDHHKVITKRASKVVTCVHLSY